MTLKKKQTSRSLGGPERSAPVVASATDAGRRIEIMHLDVAALSSTRTLEPAAEFFAVFWRGAKPVGQAYGCADVDGHIDENALRDSVQLVEAGEPIDDFSRRSEQVSVVICTRDRPEALVVCLASLQRQSRPPDQIVVIDNASLDHRTRDVALAAGVDYVREDRPGLDIARNTGAQYAKGDIIAYTDDDVALHADWLGRLLAAFDSDEIMAVTGLVLPAELETESQIIFERYWGFGRGYRRLDFDREYFETRRGWGCPVWEIGAGASMAFRRRAFLEIGYFDERLDVGAAGCSGDSEYWYRLLAAGWTCRYEPSAVAFHTHRRTFDGLSKQIFAYMRGHVAALMIQFEQHGHWANLRRIVMTLPIWFARRGVKRLIHGRDESNCLIVAEVRGALAGVAYYASSRLRAQGATR